MNSSFVSVTEWEQWPPKVHAALLTFKSIVMTLCILLNSVGLAVIIYGKLYLKTMFFILMILTCNDLLMGVTHLPLSLYAGEVGPQIEGTAACTLLALSMRFFNANSLLGLTIYNTDRFLAIEKPYFYLLWVNKTRISIIWGIISVLNTAIKFTIVLTAPMIVYSHNHGICADYSPEGVVSTRLRYIPELIFSVACYVIIIVTSFKISRTVKIQREKIRVQDTVSGYSIHPKDASHLASFRSVMLMTLVLIVTGLPRFVMLLAPRDWQLLGAQVAVIWLVYTNSILNILIFGFSYKEFILSMKRLFNFTRGGNKINVQNIT